MGIRIAETSNGVVVNLIQQKLDGKLSPSVFQAKAVPKNRFGIITKDMWYKIHPLPTVLFANAFISARRQEPPLLSQTTDTTGTTGKTKNFFLHVRMRIPINLRLYDMELLKEKGQGRSQRNPRSHDKTASGHDVQDGFNGLEAHRSVRDLGYMNVLPHLIGLFARKNISM